MSAAIDFHRQHSLLMLSGGVDSVYLLHQVLAHTDDVLWVHHVNLVNREGRHRAEAHACAAVVAWCTEHLRPFRYTESTIDHSAFELFGRDLVLVAFEAGVVVQNAHAYWRRGFDRWLLGYCKEEAAEVVDGVPVVSTNRRGLIETCLATSAAPMVPPTLHSQALLTKREQLLAMPADLARLAWTCRRPVWRDEVPLECGVCKTCQLMAPLRAELSLSISSPTQGATT